MSVETKELGKVEMRICKVEGISTKTGKPFTMLTFKYFDPYLQKDVQLTPDMVGDKTKLELLYIQGWVPPNI